MRTKGRSGYAILADAIRDRTNWTPQSNTKTAAPKVESLLCVKLTVHRWSGRAVNKSLSSDVEQSSGAEHDSIQTTIRMLPKDIRHKLGACANQLRTAWQQRTLPWEDGGWRILPAAQYNALTAYVGPLRQSLQEVIDEIIANSDTLREQARRRLGKAFIANKFPTRQELERMFGISLSVRTVQDPNDARIVGVSEQDQARIKEAMRQDIAAHMQQAVAGIVEQLTALVNSMVERVGKKDQKGIKYNSMRQRALDTCTHLDTLKDVVGNEALGELIAAVRSTLTTVKPNALRVDPYARNKMKRKASALQTALASFGTAQE